MSNIINAKVKFCRNLKNVFYAPTIDSNQQQEVLNRVLEVCNSNGLKGDHLENLNKDVLKQMVGLRIIEKNHSDGDISYKGFASNDDASVQINGLNHVEVMANAQNILDAYSKAKSVDKILCNKLNFDYNDKYGFLSPDLNCLGSGMRISVVLMLPALSRVDAIRALPTAMDKLSFEIKPINPRSGMYLITSGASLGCSEKQVCELTQSYIDKILKCEIDMCHKFTTDKDDVMDKVLRAKAIINSCIKMSYNEMANLGADILIAYNGGMDIGIAEDEINKLINICKILNLDEINLAKSIKNILK